MNADKVRCTQPEVEGRFLACPHVYRSCCTFCNSLHTVFSFDVTHQAFRSRRLQAHHCNWNHPLNALMFHYSQPFRNDFLAACQRPANLHIWW